MTAIIVVSLALGIGANTMIFTLVNAFLLRPPPYPDPDRVAMVWFVPPNAPPQARGGANRQNCFALVERSRSFSNLGCFWQTSANLPGEGQGGAPPELLQGQSVTAGLFGAVGVNPAIGRWFTQTDFDSEAPVTIISYDLWQRRFGGTPDVLGKTIRLDTVTRTIVGVMPSDFVLLNPEAKWWIPFLNPPHLQRSPTRILLMVGRLNPGISIAQAQAEMGPLATTLSEEIPETNKGWKILVQQFQEAFSGGARQPLLTFQGAVLLVLLIACANVAGLLLAQGAAQHKELAVRSALGSSRWRIVRQLLTESVVLALMGGVLGLGIGWAGLKLFLSALPQGAIGDPRQFSLDLNVLSFTLLLSIGTGLLFGILPALQISRPDLMDALRENSRSATATRTRQKLRSVFVVVQVSLALVLLVGAGLLMRSFLRVSSVPPGFDYKGLTTFQIVFPQGDYVRDTGQPTPTGSREVEVSPRIAATSEQILERLRTIPGVTGATAGFTAPLFPGVRVYNFTIEGRPAPPPPDAQGPASQGPNSQWLTVMSGWFETIGVPLVRGRRIGPQDSAAGAPIVVINETAAKRYWPNEDPIGKRIKLDYWNDQTREIIGIVGDTKQNLREREASAQMYIPWAQLPVLQAAQFGLNLQTVTFVVRTSGNLDSIVPAMRSAAAAVIPTLATTNTITVPNYASRQTLDQWIYTTLLSIFGGIALLLAIVGIYGVMAHSVAQRTGEIGVRVALGASSRDVLRLVLRRGVLLIALGMLVGTTVALALTRVIQSVLWNVTATDPLTFVLALAALAGIALLACYIPARRALKIDPITALRYE